MFPDIVGTHRFLPPAIVNEASVTLEYSLVHLGWFEGKRARVVT